VIEFGEMDPKVVTNVGKDLVIVIGKDLVIVICCVELEVEMDLKNLEMILY